MRLIPLALVALLGACTGATVVKNDDTAAPAEQVEDSNSAAPESDDSAEPADDSEDDPVDDTDPTDDGESEQVDTDGDGVLDWLDCEPEDESINQAATDDSCDGIDQDCDGEDGSDIPTATGGSVCGGEDVDGDGYMTVNSDGTVVDCNDSDDSVHPGAEEVADDGIDQDCDGEDEVTPSTDNDADDDGFDSVDAGGTDCDDADASVNPGATEIPDDGVDNDCDGEDEVTPSTDNDADDDGFDSVDAGGTDCDDADASINPDADEVAYDGIDQDCDELDLVDVDCDGYAAFNDAGDVVDCDDFDASINPDATEIPDDGLDNDCADGDEVTEPAAEVPDDLGEELTWLRVDGASLGMLLSSDTFASSVSGDEVCVTGFGVNSSWDCQGEDMVSYDSETGFMWYEFGDGSYRVTLYSEDEGEWAQYSDECADESTDSALCYANSDAQGNGNGTDGDDGYALCLEVVGGFVYELDDSTCATM